MTGRPYGPHSCRSPDHQINTFVRSIICLDPDHFPVKSQIHEIGSQGTHKVSEAANHRNKVAFLAFELLYQVNDTKDVIACILLYVVTIDREPILEMRIPRGQVQKLIVIEALAFARSSGDHSHLRRIPQRND